MSEEAADAEGGVLLKLSDLHLCDATSSEPSLTDTTSASSSSPCTFEPRAEPKETEDKNDLFLSENGISYSGCTPKDAINCKDGYFYAVHFHDCCLRDVNFDNCTMINVSFKDCIFDATKWSNVYMEEVEVVDCVFNGHILHNACQKDTTIVGKTYEQKTEFGDFVPEEVVDQKWLQGEKDKVAERMGTLKEVEKHAPKPRVEFAKARKAYVEQVSDPQQVVSLDQAMERDIRDAKALRDNSSNIENVIKGWYALAYQAETGDK